MNHFTNREKIFAAVVVILLFVVSVSFFYSFGNEKVSNDEMELPFPKEVSEIEGGEVPTSIVIDIKGAVHAPGVYEMQEGSRVKDAVEKAGGLVIEADVLKINLAQLLQDEMVIYVPFQGEETSSEVTQTTAAADGKIAVNHASEEELQTLPGIGPAKAKAIIRFRKEHGPFKSEEDLLNIQGIGEKSLEKLKEYITVN